MTNAELLALLRDARERLTASIDPLGLADDNQIAINGFRTAELCDRIDAALAEAEKPAEPPIGQCRLCGPRTREQAIGVYGHGERLFVCSRCGVTIRGYDGSPVVEKLRGDK